MLRRVLRSRWLQGAMVCLLAVVMLGANDPEMRYERVGHEMMCACGCGQVLLECNHVGCPDSSRMIGELRDQLSSGASDKKILEWFAAKYGATILAAPIRGGFDLVAWIMPIAVFLMATVGTALLIRIWKRRHDLALAGQPAPAALPHTPALDALRERIRKETEY